MEQQDNDRRKRYQRTISKELPELDIIGEEILVNTTVHHTGRSIKKQRSHRETMYRERLYSDERERTGRRDRLRIRRKRRRRIQRRILAVSSIAIMLLLTFMMVKTIRYRGQKSAVIQNLEDFFDEQSMGKQVEEMPVIMQDFLTPNEYSRPGEELEKVKNIFVHYTANQNTSAEQNRSYFENLGITGERSASAHFVIGYDGNIIQCIPLEEIGYAVMQHNYDSVSIECCYLSMDGSFTEETYDALIALTAWLVGKYNLTPDDVLRHYDAGGKLCPKYYAESPKEWERFKMDLENYIDQNGS